MGKKSISSGFAVINSKNEILLGRVDNHGTSFNYTVFKGGQEDGEELIDTATRELKEETGIDLSVERNLSKYVSSSPIFTYSLKKKDVYIFRLDDKKNVLKNFKFHCSSVHGPNNEPEIYAYKWVKLEDMKKYVFPSQRGLAAHLNK